MKADRPLPELIVGCWQLSAGHSARRIDRERLFEAWAALIDAGFDTFDCADIYTGVERILGEFRSWLRTHRGVDGASRLRVHTKLVPDLAGLPGLSRAQVVATVDRSLNRLGVERLDLVQIHWWDYAVPGCVDMALWVDELRRGGKIRRIGATNFDVSHLREIIGAGVPLHSHQVQYSLLDRRPENGMSELCVAHGVSLLCYGTLAGGMLTDRWHGVSDPGGDVENRSLAKYRLIVDEIGGWDALQGLLDRVASVARRHDTDAAAVATRWVLARDGVRAAIVGVRDGSHLESWRRGARLRLDEQDLVELDASLVGLPCPQGDTFGLERVPGGRHTSLLRTGLGREGSL